MLTLRWARSSLPWRMRRKRSRGWWRVPRRCLRWWSRSWHTTRPRQLSYADQGCQGSACLQNQGKQCVNCIAEILKWAKARAIPQLRHNIYSLFDAKVGRRMQNSSWNWPLVKKNNCALIFYLWIAMLEHFEQSSFHAVIIWYRWIWVPY